MFQNIGQHELVGSTNSYRPSRRTGIEIIHGREITEAIQSNPLFTALTSTAIASLLANATVLKLRSGVLVGQSRSRSIGSYIVIDGRIALRINSPRNGGKVLNLIGPSGHVGLAASMQGISIGVTGEALVDSRLLFIPRDALLSCVASNAELGLRIVAVLAHEIDEFIADIERLASYSGRQRIAHYILQLVGSGIEPLQTFLLPAKKNIIASLLNLTPEYFSRGLRELISDGAIDVYGRKITVLDLAILRAAVCC